MGDSSAGRNHKRNKNTLVLNMSFSINQKAFTLSIITVCRNAKARLIDTVQSVEAVKAKTKIRIQHLLIDGASTDGTVSLLEKLKRNGQIEDFISEPDNGIYDAMNKGIHLAKGYILYFLNAGDLLLNAKVLEECVAPLLKGEKEHAAAPVVTRLNKEISIDSPCFEYVFLRTPCCHQGYFATASLYRNLGGYHHDTYRCLADADLICRAYTMVGPPLIVDKPVAEYPADGFSSNCVFHYLPEYIELTNQNWATILQISKKDVEYRDLITGILADRCIEMVKWKNEKGENCSHYIHILQKQLHSLAKICKHPLRKACLLWAARSYLSIHTTHSTISPLQEKLMYWSRIVCSMRPGNKYALNQGFPARSLNEALLAKFRSLFKI